MLECHMNHFVLDSILIMTTQNIGFRRSYLVTFIHLDHIQIQYLYYTHISLYGCHHSQQQLGNIGPQPISDLGPVSHLATTFEQFHKSSDIWHPIKCAPQKKTSTYCNPTSDFGDWKTSKSAPGSWWKQIYIGSNLPKKFPKFLNSRQRKKSLPGHKNEYDFCYVFPKLKVVFFFFAPRVVSKKGMLLYQHQKPHGCWNRPRQSFESSDGSNL